MITIFKLYEARKKVNETFSHVLCVKANDGFFGQRVTEGKTYETYKAYAQPPPSLNMIERPSGALRIKDDRNEFMTINQFKDDRDTFYCQSSTNVLFTLDKTMDDYRKKLAQKRFGLL